MSENPATVGDTLAELIRYEMAGRCPLEQRIIANRVKSAIESWIPARVQTPADLIPMSDQEASVFEASLMEFGKYAGKNVYSVSWDYLEWLADAGRKNWRQIHTYLNSPRVKREREAAEREKTT